MCYGNLRNKLIMKKDKLHKQYDKNQLLNRAYKEYNNPDNTKEEKSHWKGVISALCDTNYKWSFPQIVE